MKKLLIIALAAIFSTNSFAGTNDAAAKTTGHFKTAHSNAKFVSWKVTPNYTEASYTENGHIFSAFYNVDGEFVYTKRSLKLDDLPLAASKAIQERFANYSVIEVAEFIDPENDWAYYATVENAKQTQVIKISPYGDITTLKKIKK